MGQYQQWLFAQEVDRHLRAEREALETELLYLQDRITIMQQSVPEAENTIVQALEAHFQAERSLAEAPEREPLWGTLPHTETPGTRAGEPWHTPGLPAGGQGAEDIQAFFDDQRHTDPTLAAWTARGGARGVGKEHVGDAETRRLNENIRRWFIRWRRQVVATERPEEVQNE
jgi:hypothetical protein